MCKCLDTTPLDYYLSGHMNSLIYEIKLQMVAKLLTSCIFDATVKFRNDGIMNGRATNYLLKRMRTCLREGRWWPH
jgi:hypothetical protein